MKSGMAGALGALAFLVVAGPLHQVLDDSPATAPSLPSWVTLPANAEVTRLSLTSATGQEAASGSVDVAVSGDGTLVLAELQRGLAARGFHIDVTTTSVDFFMGASGVVTAMDPASGRRLRIVRIETPAGSILRLSYEDPAPMLAQAE